MKFVSKVYNNNINNNKVTKVKRVLAPSAEKAKRKQRNIDF